MYHVYPTAEQVTSLVTIASGKGAKPISTKLFSKIQRTREPAAVVLFIAILLTGLIGCTPATPIVLDVPTNAAVVLTETPAIPPTETPTPSPTQTPFNPIATIKIVVHAPLTEGGSHIGKEILRAAEVAVYELAGPLNELGYAVELVSYDDQADIEIAVANAKKIVADPEILCGLGHYQGSLMVQASEVYHQNGLAFISPATTLATITDRYYPEVNRIVGRDDGQGMAGAHFAADQGFERVYIVHNNSSYSEKSADYFRREAYNLGVSVIGISATEDTANFDGIIRQVLAYNPEMVFISTRTDQAGPFIRELRAAGYMGTIMGTDVANRPDLVELAGPALVEGGGTYFTETVAPASSYPGGAQFTESFRRYYGAFPKLYAAQAYDATGMCLKAVEEASKANDGAIPTRKEVATAVRAIVGYNGVTGNINLNNKGDKDSATYFIYKVESPNPENWNQNTLVTTYDVEPPK